MSNASNLSMAIYAYVDLVSGDVKSMFVQTHIGITYRVNSDWELPNNQAHVDELTGGFDCYVLNWDKNLENVPEEVPDDFDEEHEAVYKFDRGELNLSNIERYFDLAYKAGEGI